MRSSLTFSVVVAVVFAAACSNSPSYGGGPLAGGVDSSGHKLVQCERYAPTGSRIRNHVTCDDGSRSDGFEVRTWKDISEDRAH